MLNFELNKKPVEQEYSKRIQKSDKNKSYLHFFRIIATILKDHLDVSLLPTELLIK